MKDGKPNRIDSIVISTQHDEFDNDDKMLKKIKSDIVNLFIPRFLKITLSIRIYLMIK